MKNQLIIALALATVLLGGCATTKFTANHAPGVFQGKGGTPYPVDGIDFWETGDSDRQYKIIGVIEAGRSGAFRSVFSNRDSSIAKVARKQGGDAVIFVNGDAKPAIKATSFDDDVPEQPKQNMRYLVIKYLD